MISVSWNYLISKFLLEKVEELCGDVTAVSILLEPVPLSRSYFPYRWPDSSFQYLVQIHIAIHWTIEPHHWKTTTVDNAHTSHDFFTVCFIAFNHFMLVYWCPASVILRMWRWSKHKPFFVRPYHSFKTRLWKRQPKLACIDHIWRAVAEDCAAHQEESCTLYSGERRAFWTLFVKCLLFNKCPG